MGQLHGKACFVQAAKPFLNASEKDINKLWEGFNDVAEGFGLNQDELVEICRALQSSMQITIRLDMDQLSAALFQALDTDDNGLVDALEFLGTIAMISAMPIDRKLTFIYNCYDFNEAGEVSVDELTLAMRSTLTGLCKLSLDIACPSEMTLEDIAIHAFHQSQKTSSEDTLTLFEFLKFANTMPEVMTWVDYFDNGTDFTNQNRFTVDQEVSDSATLPLATTYTATSSSTSTNTVSFPLDPKAPIFAEDKPLPVQPWQMVVQNAEPSAPPPLDPTLPNASLSLDWIYGFNSDLRQSMRYLSVGEIVYPAGAVVIMYDVIQHKQRFATFHSGPVQCLAINPTNGRIVASGEGRQLRSKIVIWNSQQLVRPLSVIQGFHTMGITDLKWMSDGRTLVSIGEDTFHTVAVYQWPFAANKSTDNRVDWPQSPSIIFADRCGREQILGCITTTSGLDFVTCGQRHIFFWHQETADRQAPGNISYLKRPGILGATAKMQALLCVAVLQLSPAQQKNTGCVDMILAGASQGHILVFEGRNCVKAIKAHGSAVNVLHTYSGGLISGGKDGKVRMWSKRLEPGPTFDIDALGSISSRIHSLAASPDGGAKLIVSTSGAEVYEISANDGSNLHRGAIINNHYAYELHGMATHPMKQLVTTVGDDRTVRVWDIENHRLIRIATLESPLRSCGYSPDGTSLVVGQGADTDDEALLPRFYDMPLVNPDRQGAFVILKESSLAVQYEAKDAKRAIRNVKFSSTGQTLAVGSSDCNIYLYNAEDWASKGKCKTRDTSLVLSHLDFASSEEYIMANAVNKGEMAFFEVASGVEITRIATLKDIDWHTWTCIYGWPMQGAWPQTTKSCYEVSSAARSYIGQGGVIEPLLVTGDTDGILRLYRYPCASGDCQGQLFKASATSISNVLFTAENKFVISCSQKDRCIFQWRVEYDDTSNDVHHADEYEYNPTSDDELELRDDIKEPDVDHEAVRAGDFGIELLHQYKEKQAVDAAEKEVKVAPVKPWVSSAVPPKDAPREEEIQLAALPSTDLELEWVYGYRSEDARNNAFITKAKGLWVYPAANIVVVLDPKLWTQRHFKQHTGAVLSLAIHCGSQMSRSARPMTGDRPPTSKSSAERVSGEIAASGESGKYPAIHVWRIDTLELLASLRGVHRCGVSELRFNSSGVLLASVDLDATCTLAIYDWRNKTLLAQASASQVGRICGLTFLPDVSITPRDGDAQAAPSYTNLMTVGVNAITLWRLGNGNLVKKEGVFGKRGMKQTFLSVVEFGNAGDAIVGTTSGELFRFKGPELMSVVSAHTRCVAALHCCKTKAGAVQLASGGKDGVVKLWNNELECLAEFTEFNVMKYAIRSVFWDDDRGILLVGTRDCGLHQLSAVDGTRILPRTPDGVDISNLSHHFKGSLLGMSVCATKNRMCTTGDDGVLRVWDSMRHVLVIEQAIDTSSRACAYAPEGEFIAVGLGGSLEGKRHKKDGGLLVFEDHGMSVDLVFETRDCKMPISVTVFSPDGQSLVVGALDNNVYIYDVPNNFSKRAVFSKHKSFITNIDISSDSQYLRSSCGAFELLFADITTGSHVASATALRDLTWDTCTTLYNWSNRGMWPASTAATQAQHVVAPFASASSSLSSKDHADTGEEELLIAGMTHGSLRLFKFPCFIDGAGWRSYAGHSGEVSRLAFSPSRSHCMTAGALDRCVLQWRVKKITGVSESEDVSRVPAIVQEGTKEMEIEPELQLEGQFIPENCGMLLSFGAGEVVKPYMSAIIAPSDASESTAAAESKTTLFNYTFELEHIFGFRAYDARNNASYCRSGHILFPAGCVAVCYDRRLGQQTLYTQHSRPIVCLAQSGDGSLAATGEMVNHDSQRENPVIHIWEPSACKKVTELGPFHRKAISYIAFNPSRKLLAAVGQDEHHSITVYTSTSGLWSDATLLCAAKCGRERVFFATFVEDTSKTSYHLVSGGQGDVLFWKIDAPQLIVTRGEHSARSDGRSIPQLCGGSMGSSAITGGSNGQLYVWNAAVVSKVVPAHNGPIYAVHTSSTGMVTGGFDGRVRLWTTDITPLAEFDISNARPTPLSPIIKSVYWDTPTNRILVGTKTGELLELSQITSDTALVLESHAGLGYLSGLSVHPTDPNLVATVGEDQTVRVWDLIKKEARSKATLDAPLRAAAYSGDGVWLAVGYGEATTGETSASEGGGDMNGKKNGAFVVLDAISLEILHEGRDSRQSINDMVFSPDGTMIAMGGNDHAVYIYSTLDGFALRFKFTRATGRVMHLDFSSDSSVVRFDTDAMELIYVSTLDGSQVTSVSTMRDVQWANASCVLTWETQGLWDPAYPQLTFDAVARAHKSPWLAAANNDGEIRLLPSPCVTRGEQAIILSGHGASVTNVSFTCDDEYIVSVGGRDQSLLVWKVAPKSIGTYE